MKKTYLLLFFFYIYFSGALNAQEGFHFLNANKAKQRISFKLINNLIVIPLEINGEKLSFILDSGVSKTILLNISQNDSLGLNNVERVNLRGLGEGVSVEALLSKKNKLSLKNIESNDETIYVILKDHFDLSGKMGITIHGIIGYNLLKKFIVKINYKTKKIDFYNPKLFKKINCKKCETFPLQFYRRKPYVDAKIQLDTIGNKLTDVKLLIDSGGSDSIWLFENSKEIIKTPHLFFKDILGEGLSGAIYGNRSRIPKIKLKSFEIKGPTVSFLDSLSTHNARSFKERNGSIGAGILKKFIVWFDYPNSKLTLKKNGSFSKGFNYNMSGLDVVYNGKKLIKEKDYQNYSINNNQNGSSNNTINFITSYSYRFKPSFKIKNVVAGSPADKVGLLIGDIILKINYKAAHNYTLSRIMHMFQEKENKKIKMTVDRNGEKMTFEFRLVKKI